MGNSKYYRADNGRESLKSIVDKHCDDRLQLLTQRQKQTMQHYVIETGDKRVFERVWYANVICNSIF